MSEMTVWNIPNGVIPDMVSPGRPHCGIRIR